MCCITRLWCCELLCALRSTLQHGITWQKILNSQKTHHFFSLTKQRLRRLKKPSLLLLRRTKEGPKKKTKKNCRMSEYISPSAVEFLSHTAQKRNLLPGAERQCTPSQNHYSTLCFYDHQSRLASVWSHDEFAIRAFFFFATIAHTLWLHLVDAVFLIFLGGCVMSN